MQAACEAGEVFAWLEGGAGGARSAGDAFAALYHAVREPWLVRALLQYHARTGSERALQLLARAPEPHARHALDALLDQLRGERLARHHALAALAPLVARRPPWLHLLLPPSPLARELLRAARRERDPAPLLNALLALAALLPAAPALAAAHAAELAEALTRPAPCESAAARAHLALGARALFRAAYATHPCTVVEALRASGAELGAGPAREAWENAVEALARGVALHPALVTSSRRGEADAARWARSEPHDVLAECGRLALTARDEAAPEPSHSPAPLAPPPAPEPLLCRHSPAPLPGSGAQAALAAGALRPGGEGWFALGERTGADAAPHTPLPSEREPEPEPEPAVEATPENTPARLARQAFRFPAADSPAARAIGRTPPPSGPAPAPAAAAAPDAAAARLARVAAERRAQDSPVPFGGAPPAQAARPEPRPARAAPSAPDLDEDREVRELTRPPAPTPPLACPWSEAVAEGEVTQAARALARPLARRAGAAAAPPRRAASCGPEGARRREVASQTVDAWPEPYEFLVADFYSALSDEDAPALQDKNKSTQLDASTRPTRCEDGDPSERLDRYLAELYTGVVRGKDAAPAPAPGPGATAAELAEQLALAHAQLMYERWRRDAHAERNRRLLGRCRTVRALELSNAALSDRVRALTRERDRLLGAAPAAPRAPAALAHAAPAPREAALEAALQEERAARLRAEAALREAEAGRARDAAELQRTRGESFEAARHVEALARAACAAERRAEHVRRLRRELLLLAEREARLGAAVRGALAQAQAPAGAAEEGALRALRAACARAEADAEAAGARAEAAQARAHELEALAAAREAALAELKRAGRAAAEEGAARLRAHADKYAALLRVVRAQGARDLERRAAMEGRRDDPVACG